MDIQRLSLFDAIIQANLARRASLKSLAFLKPRPSLQVGLQILSQVVRARNVPFRDFGFHQNLWDRASNLSQTPDGILKDQVSIKNLDGVKAGINAPAITHVMYADDIVLFSKATKRNASTSVECIDIYCKWSGQCLNRAKYGVFFSKRTPYQSQRAIKHILKMKKLKQDAIYSGAPLFLSKSPSKDFKYLVNRLETKLTSWRSKTLSRVGRTLL